MSYTELRFTGQREGLNDAAGLGLYDYKARFYSTVLGLFLSADPFVPGPIGGLNRYSYVRGNPLKYRDPTGHCWTPNVSCNPGVAMNFIRCAFRASCGDPANAGEQRNRQHLAWWVSRHRYFFDLVKGYASGNASFDQMVRSVRRDEPLDAGHMLWSSYAVAGLGSEEDANGNKVAYVELASDARSGHATFWINFSYFDFRIVSKLDIALGNASRFDPRLVDRRFNFTLEVGGGPEGSLAWTTFAGAPVASGVFDESVFFPDFGYYYEAKLTVNGGGIGVTPFCGRFCKNFNNDRTPTYHLDDETHGGLR
jgi:RHS repeat-associated protein